MSWKETFRSFLEHECFAEDPDAEVRDLEEVLEQLPPKLRELVEDELNSWGRDDFICIGGYTMALETFILYVSDKRRCLLEAFENFLRRDSVDDWTLEDDAVLYKLVTVGIEIFTGEDGERVFKDIMTQAKALSRYRKLRKYLENRT